MFKKSLVAVAVVATLGSTISASAFENFFAEHQTQETSQVKNTGVDLGSFNSPAAGVVEIYDYRLGTMGDLLGSNDVTEGANQDVRINLSPEPHGNLVAVLKNGDEVVGMEMIRIIDK